VLINPVRIEGLKAVQRFGIVGLLLLGHAQAQSQSPARDNGDPKTLPYNALAFTRDSGNVGRWWSLMNENDKAAFLDGYQQAMSQSRLQTESLCKVLRDAVKPSSDQQAFINEMSAAISVCQQTSDFVGFEKITTKDLDDFYSDPMNQPILLVWSMEYLRDKASGRKTEGQLLDALKAEQKDVHDCGKYPHLCKLGTKESGPSH